MAQFTSELSSDTLATARSHRGAPAMQQIVEWLEKLGMSEYAGRFAESRIDFSVLPDLTDQHLKDLGLPLGDRLKILRAIPRSSAADEVIRTARSDEHGAALARSVKAAASPGTTGSGVRLVHRGLRHARSERGKSVARRARLVCAILPLPGHFPYRLTSA
jgi:SAM domain (Sterile alpha motif)